MELKVRRTFTIVDQKTYESGIEHDVPLRRVAVGLVIGNPYAGIRVDDLSELIDASRALGALMGEMLVEAMGQYPVECYGKGGVVGINGELEHVNALLTTTYAEPLREAVGGALAWIPSFTKLAAPGAVIDVPVAHKDALYVRSHYNGMTVNLPPDTPAADELALIFCAANRSRLNARVGGLTHDQVSARDGLR